MSWFSNKLRRRARNGNPGDDALLDMLERHEGFEALPYRCPAGKLTVGYGHNLEEPMSMKAARHLLKDDVGRTVGELCSLFPKLLAFSKNRKYALINMCFNLGITRFKKFKKMIAAIHNEDWEKAADEMEASEWYVQVGDRARELIAMMRTEEFV